MTDPVSGSLDETSRRLPWWERWPGRLEAEIGRFAAHGLKVTVLEDPREGADRLVVQTSMDLPEHGPTRLVVVYPAGFPHRRFAIYAPELRLPRHQAPGGNLCVLARGAEYWHPGFMAADIAYHRVPRLVALVEEGGERLRASEDPQGEPVTAYFNSVQQGGIIVDQRGVGVDAAAAASGAMTLGFDREDMTWLNPPPSNGAEWVPPVGQGMLLGLQDQNRAQLLAEPEQSLAGRYPVRHEGRWVYFADPPYAETAQQLWDAAMAADDELSRWAATHAGYAMIGVCMPEEIEQGVYELGWVFIARHAWRQPPPGIRPKARRGRNAPMPQHGIRRETEPVIVRALRWTARDLAVRIPELAPMRTATVSVVGLGSLGAPFVQEMAKARVGSLHLADFDHIEPGTSVRYPLGLQAAGLHKALALARWVQAHNPEVDVSVEGLQVGAIALNRSGPSENEQISAILAGADLLVSATAEHDVNRQLDQEALTEGVARLYLWSQSGYGGVVALLRPGGTGCYHCLELMLSKAARDGSPLIAVPPNDARGVPAGTVQGAGCADQTFTAPHADLLPIAIQAARVAYGQLCSDAPTGYPRMAGDVFAVQVREASGEPIPPRWTSYTLHPDPECAVCSAP